MAHLEQWSLNSGAVSPYTAPELATQHLHGIVSNHPNCPDGDVVTTTSVEEIDFAARAARTRNTEYTLGEPSADWLKWCEDNGHDTSKILNRPIPDKETG